MIADYMENGFLENTIDMFKYDKTLYPLIGGLIGDKRIKVRVGAVALVEALKEKHLKDILTAIPEIAKHLKDTDPTVRGDTAYLLGVIGHKNAIPFLLEALNSGNENDIVKETIKESIEMIGI